MNGFRLGCFVVVVVVPSVGLFSKGGISALVDWVVVLLLMLNMFCFCAEVGGVLRQW